MKEKERKMSRRERKGERRVVEEEGNRGNEGGRDEGRDMKQIGQNHSK